MNQWISAVNSYFYPYMIYHVTHERLVFPELGIASDEKVVAHALPKVETGLAVVERQLAHGKDFLLGDELSIADFYLLPSTFAFSLTAEGQAMYPKFPAFCRWRERMDNLPATQKVRAAVQRLPIEHARDGLTRTARNIDHEQPCRGGCPPLGLTTGKTQAPRQTASPSKPCATLGFPRGLHMDGILAPARSRQNRNGMRSSCR